MTLTAVVKVTIILFLCGLLNCIRADLFMDNALYKWCIIKNTKIQMVLKNIHKLVVYQIDYFEISSDGYFTQKKYRVIVMLHYNSFVYDNKQILPQTLCIIGRLW